MEKLEDRNSREFKAQEAALYSDCEIYTTEIEKCKKIEENPYMYDNEKVEARKEREELEYKRQTIIDNWKEEHGQYDDDKAYKTRIDGSCIEEENEFEDEEDYCV